MTTTDARVRGPLEASGLVVAYGPVTALRDVSVTASPGEFVAVTGPSGAGKTTLLHALAGALPPAAGVVRHAGTVLDDRRRAAVAGIALVPQGNGLVGALTGYENLVVALGALGVRPRDAARRARERLDGLGLADWADHLVEEYSGGQQQRVAVARALALDPTVLLADEPTSDLDAGNRELVVTLLREHARAGAVVVMTTHDAQTAAAADRAVHLDDGRLVGDV